MGAFLFFAFGIIKWEDAQRNVDWGLIVFFGGALSLGAALLTTGAANWIIQQMLGLLGSDPSTHGYNVTVNGYCHPYHSGDVQYSSISHIDTTFRDISRSTGITYGNLCCTSGYRLFTIIHVPYGRSNRSHGLRNQIREHQRDIESRNTHGSNWNYPDHHSDDHLGTTFPLGA